HHSHEGGWTIGGDWSRSVRSLRHQFVSGLDALSRAAGDSRQRVLPPHGPCSDLYSDCRKLHPIHFGSYARTVGVVAVRRSLGPCRNGIDIESASPHSIFTSDYCLVRADGMARSCGDATNSHVNTDAWCSVDCGGRSGLHGGTRLLWYAEAAVQSLHLASLCDGRHCMSFLRGAVVRGMKAGGRNGCK